MLMTNGDLVGIVVSYAYAISLLLFAETMRRLFGCPQSLTRKFIHIGAGMWVFSVPLVAAGAVGVVMQGFY